MLFSIVEDGVPKYVFDGQLKGGSILLPQKYTPATPTLAFGDGDSGFYESTDDDIGVSIGGTNLWKFKSSYMGSAGGNAVFRNILASDIIANIVPKATDDNTGIGHAGDDILSLIAGGVEGIRITETAGAITNNLNGQTILPQSDIVGTPTLAFGDGDTGFYECNDDIICVSINGVRRAAITEIGIFGHDGTSATGLIKSSQPSYIVPSIAPKYSDMDTGVGHAAADQLSLIAGGVEGIRITEVAGAIAVDVNGGLNAKGCVALEKGIQYNRVAVAASTYTTTIDDSIIGVTYTASGAVTITISSAHIAMQGKDIRIVDEGGNAGTNNITIATEGGEKISGADTQTISADYGRLRIYTDGSNCFLS